MSNYVTMLGVLITEVFELVSLLSRIFIKNRTDYMNPAVRLAYGTLCSIWGMLLNILMFAGKFAAGTISGSIAIVADAFNNLSDALSGVITFIGFKLSGKKPDEDHPFGHGRMEYLSGLLLSVLVILMGAKLLEESIGKLTHPEPLQTGVLAYVILGAAILLKLYMAFYNHSIGKKIDSAAMKAVVIDSLSDVVTTTVVLATAIIYQFTGKNLDAYGGLVVSALILFAGYKAIKETISPLLGSKPDPEFVKQVEEITMKQEDVVGIHDLIVHDYGPGRVFVSLHAEVPGDKDIYDLHEQVDAAEVELSETLGCHAVIHMDPIDVNDEEIKVLREKTTDAITNYNSEYSIHDFRMVPGKKNTNLVFDVVVPASVSIADGKIEKELKHAVEEACEGCTAVITVEHSFI